MPKLSGKQLVFFFICLIGLSISSCSYFDECFMSNGSTGTFQVVNQVPDFTLAVGDSVVINMANYWSATYGCANASYIPYVLSATSDSSHVEIRSSNQYLYLKGLSKGNATVKVFALQQSDSIECVSFHKSIERSLINLRVDTVTSNRFSPIELDFSNNRILRVEVDSLRFGLGDTLLLRAITSDTSSYVSDKQLEYPLAWTFETDEEILYENTLFCSEATVIRNTHSLKIVHNSADSVIKGFVHVGPYRNGFAFRFKSNP
ncbi:hypothetical protein EP331_08045 [bacterium]|nr:MAG: hypothetical protein EP331_08045 [bacterium]